MKHLRSYIHFISSRCHRGLLFGCTVLFLLSCSASSQAQSPAHYREYEKEFTTYPFSDPDPVPNPGQIYPYFRFDGFTEKPVQKKWKVVELENDYIRVMILPEVGGKIWAAIEKSSGRSFIYYNHVIKFRDVAMRGPWTSGGLEPNYGIIGHTPNCATPVDYQVRSNPDKSVSCFIGVLDLLTRSHWQIEIRLPADKAWFSTHSFWYNPQALEEPYYHWMNTGIPTQGNLEFIYPGNRYIGHEGEYASWPVNEQNGKHINWYEENNFGGYKSYHVFGKYSDFFGAYWHDTGFGMVHYAPHEDKIGKKIWIWGLSRQGMIWEKMLTDSDGQYAEVQAGRLYNQSAEGSSFTPFKHRSFAPHATDTWTEYWYPVMQTGGFVAANQSGALNVRAGNGRLKLDFSPVAVGSDTLQVVYQGKNIYQKPIRYQPLQAWHDSLSFNGDSAELRVSLLISGLHWSGSPKANVLDRPVETPADFDWNSTYGLYVQGKELADQKYYARAAEKLDASLQKDSNFLPALVKRSELFYRDMHYREAYALARRALSIDTHDGAANYYYGLSAAALHDPVNARDGLDVATLSEAFRSAAYTELARLDLQEKRWEDALRQAGMAIDYNRYDMSALSMQAVAWRHLGNNTKAEEVLKAMEDLNPLNLFVKMERHFLHPSESFQASEFMQNEMPEENWLELACDYSNMGLAEETEQVLTQLPRHPLALYWRAWYHSLKGEGEGEWLSQADAASPLMVFPFRSEMMPVLEWAVRQSKSWKPRYYLALLYREKNRPAQAASIFRSLGQEPGFAPFYAARAAGETADSTARESDLLKALQLDPSGWRYLRSLVQLYNAQGKYAEGLAAIEPYARQHPDDYIMGMLHARCLLQNGRYADCDALLAKLHIIPYEGATNGHELYREAKLMQALEQMRRGKYARALTFVSSARLWPENLGVGKPYDSDIDYRLEDWLQYSCLMKMKKKKEAQGYLDHILAFTPGIHNTVRNFSPASHLVSAWALEAMNRKTEVMPWLDGQLRSFPQLKQIEWARDMYQKGQSSIDLSQDASARVLMALMRLQK